MAEDQKPTTRQTVEISVEQFAFMAGVDRRTIQNAIQAGFIPRQERGILDLTDAIRGWTAFLEHKVTEATKRAAGNEVSRARAKEIEQRTAQRAKQLVPTADALDMVDEVLAVFRQELDGFPAWATRAAAERRRLEKRMDEMNAAAIGRLEKLRRRIGASDSSHEAPEAPGTGRVGKAKPSLPGKRGRPRTARPELDALRGAG